MSLEQDCSSNALIFEIWREIVPGPTIRATCVGVLSKLTWFCLRCMRHSARSRQFCFILMIPKPHSIHAYTTVKPVYKDGPRETRKVAFISRWSLCTGSFNTVFNQKLLSREIKNVVFVDSFPFYNRWSQKQIWIYIYSSFPYGTRTVLQCHCMIKTQLYL